MSVATPSLVRPRSALLIADDHAMQQRLERVLAAADYDLVITDGSDLRQWSTADAVLIDATSLPTVLRCDPPRRDEVYVVGAQTLRPEIWRSCVELGVTEAIVLDEAEGWLVERLAVRSASIASGLVVAVCGAAGGVGASTVAAGLALAASDPLHRGHAGLEPDGGVALLDLDLRRGWLDLLLGADDEGLGWSELSGLSGRIGGDALAEAVPVVNGVTLVRAHRERPVPTVPADALRAAVLAAAASFEVCLIDVPLASEHRDVALAMADVTVEVSTTDLRGMLALQRSHPVDESGGRPPAVAALRTPSRGCLPVELVLAACLDGCDLDPESITWLREVRGLERRVGRKRQPLRRRDRFVADCARLLHASVAAGSAR